MKEGIVKRWFIYTLEHYSATKKDEILNLQIMDGENIYSHVTAEIW